MARTKKKRWWDVLFPPNPSKVAKRDRKALAEGVELTDPVEFAAIRERQDTLEKRVDLLEAWKQAITKQLTNQEEGEIGAT